MTIEKEIKISKSRWQPRWQPSGTICHLQIEDTLNSVKKPLKTIACVCSKRPHSGSAQHRRQHECIFRKSGCYSIIYGREVLLYRLPTHRLITDSLTKDKVRLSCNSGGVQGFLEIFDPAEVVS